jgi:nucleoside triphosphate pyrophosphatase
VIAEAIARVEPLVLASRSPQRRAILEQLGIAFTVVEPAYEEHDPPGVTPEQVAALHARGKARSVEGRAVLGVDTVVAIDGDVLGKPADEAEAREMLARLAGRVHTVHSGLCLRVDGAEHERAAGTRVGFRPLSQREIEWYVGCGEWQGRAGGYAVQGRGAALVERLEGDYFNVVGLPVAALIDALGGSASQSD